MRRSSVARFTRRATFWSGCPNRCTLRCGASCGKPGKWTTPKGPKRFIRNLARRLEQDWNGVSASILEGIDEMLTVTRLGLPSRTAPLARLHQHHRECHGHGAQGLPQRQILALALDGPAMGRRRHAGSGQGLPSIEGIQASASSSRCSCKARPTAAFRRSALLKSPRLRKFQCATTASRISTDSGTSPRPSRDPL